MKNTLVSIFVFISFLHNSSALECYTCSIGEQDTDTTCVDDPVKLGTAGKTNCNKKYCTTIRQEYKVSAYFFPHFTHFKYLKNNIKIL